MLYSFSKLRYLGGIRAQHLICPLGRSSWLFNRKIIVMQEWQARVHPGMQGNSLQPRLPHLNRRRQLQAATKKIKVSNVSAACILPCHYCIASFMAVQDNTLGESAPRTCFSKDQMELATCTSVCLPPIARMMDLVESFAGLSDYLSSAQYDTLLWYWTMHLASTLVVLPKLKVQRCLWGTVLKNRVWKPVQEGEDGCLCIIQAFGGGPVRL